MSVEPPPLPSEVGPQPPSAFARQASYACLAAPLIMIGFSLCISGFAHNHRDGSARSLFVLFGLMSVGLFLVGAVSGLLAIVLAKSGQRNSVLLRAVSGLLLLGLLAAIAIPNFVRARAHALQHNQSLAELHTAVAEARAQAATALTNGGKTPAVDRVLESLDRAAQDGSGADSEVLKGGQLFLKRLQSFQVAYARAASELKAAKVLSAATLEQRDQIADRKAVVQNFLEANEAFKTFLEHSETNFRKELAAAGSSPAQTEMAFNGFRKGWDAQGPLMVSIREADDRLGHAILGVLELFENQWGQWSYDASAHVVRFQDHDALNQYKTLMADIKQTGADQAMTQKRLAAVLSGPASKL